MAMADSRNLSRDYARLMLVMRRMIREEFNVTIHLDAPGAGEELLHFAGLSEAPMLKEMAVELEGMLHGSERTPAPAEENRKPACKTTYYRGAPVRIPESRDLGGSGNPEESKRIYRGRKVLS